jgi:Xaa-Pro aminopeptidase
VFDPETYRRRREEILAKIEGGVAVIPGASEVKRNGDVQFPFRQDSDLHYLTGFTEPDAIAVLSRVHPEHRFVLFVRPRDKEKEVWDGPRAGVEGAVGEYGADVAFPIDQFGELLPGYLANAETLHYRLGDQPLLDARVIAAMAAMRSKTRTGVYPPATVVDLGALLHEMRLFKTPEELAVLRKAVEVSREAHLAAMREVKPGMREFEIQAVIEFHFRRHGGEAGYYPIVAGGRNATTLHYNDNNTEVRRGELLLIDAGAEIDFYTADITRTFPVRARFSAPQRAVYELVLTAQRSAMDLAKPGVTIDEIHARALKVLTEGAVTLGLCEGPAEKAIESQAFKKFYMHRTSHWLGMDVHDAGRYYRAGKSRALEPNMVITIEPGFYISADEATVDAKWRGIGVRIEDDVLITSQGHEVLSDSIARSVEDVEALCA